MAQKKDPKNKMVFCGCTMDPLLMKRLEQYAKDHDVSVSWTIRQALKSFLPMKYYNDSEGILRERK